MSSERSPSLAAWRIPVRRIALTASRSKASSAPCRQDEVERRRVAEKALFGAAHHNDQREIHDERACRHVPEAQFLGLE